MMMMPGYGRDQCDHVAAQGSKVPAVRCCLQKSADLSVPGMKVVQVWKCLNEVSSNWCKGKGAYLHVFLLYNNTKCERGPSGPECASSVLESCGTCSVRLVGLRHVTLHVQCQVI